jgi:hypothetical protein
LLKYSYILNNYIDIIWGVEFESQHPLTPTIWSDIVGAFRVFGRTWEWIFKDFFFTFLEVYMSNILATFPGANMVQGRNTLGYLRIRTFYTPERKYTYKYTSITKCLTCSPRLVFDGKAIAIFRYFVIIILYCKSIHSDFFSTRYIFYSIYFIIKYNIGLIFANTSITEYWFFSDVGR